MLSSRNGWRSGTRPACREQTGKRKKERREGQAGSTMRMVGLHDHMELGQRVLVRLHGKTKHSTVGLSRVSRTGSFGAGLDHRARMRKEEKMGREGSSRLYLLYGMQMVGIA